MSESENNPEGVPEEIPSPNTTGPLSVIRGNGEALRAWLRVIAAMFLGVLLVGYISLYSLHQALQARVTNQERRIERLNNAIDDLLTSNQNAEKIEKIEQQVEGIDGQVQDLTEAIKAQNAKAEADDPKPEPKKKKR